ncbi:hypothetical protein GCM10009594_04290 [Kocuria palustris]
MAGDSSAWDGTAVRREVMVRAVRDSTEQVAVWRGEGDTRGLSVRGGEGGVSTATHPGARTPQSISESRVIYQVVISNFWGITIQNCIATDRTYLRRSRTDQ